MERNGHLIPVGERLLDVLELFDFPGRSLTLADVKQRSGISHATALRILHTLTHRNYLLRDGRHYRLLRPRQRIRIGWTQVSARQSLNQLLTQSIHKTALAASVDVVALDNQLDAGQTVQNARSLVRERVDVATGWQRHGRVASEIAAIYKRAGIPAISVLVNQPGAIYLGVDQRAAGFAAGQELARYALEKWKGELDALLIVDEPIAGEAIKVRMQGVRSGLEASLGRLPDAAVRWLIGGAEMVDTRRAVRQCLGAMPRARRVLIATVNDCGAIGAKQAWLDLTSRMEVAILGLGGFPEVYAELRHADNPILGTIDFGAEAYGPALIDLVVQLRQGADIAAPRFLPHRFVSAREAAMLPA
jgi:ribose transport system substrate-binding protein